MAQSSQAGTGAVKKTTSRITDARRLNMVMTLWRNPQTVKAGLVCGDLTNKIVGREGGRRKRDQIRPIVRASGFSTAIRGLRAARQGVDGLKLISAIWVSVEMDVHLVHVGSDDEGNPGVRRISAS